MYSHSYEKGKKGRNENKWKKSFTLKLLYLRNWNLVDSTLHQENCRKKLLESIRTQKYMTILCDKKIAENNQRRPHFCIS